MNSLKKIVWGGALAALFLIGAFILWGLGQYQTPILMYHQIMITNDQRLILNSVSPASFDKQMKFIVDNHYNVLSFDEFIKAKKAGKPLARNSVVIQFDDGYDNNYTEAFPILKKYGLPALVYVVADKVGTPGYISWDQARQMHAEGFSIGAHTRTHAYLPDLTYDKAYDEIAEGKKIIESHLGSRVDYFAYPSGGFNQQAKDIAKAAGFQAAVSTNRGLDKSNQDLFELKRIRIKDTDHGIALRAKLSGYYNLFRKSKQGY